MNFTQKMQNCQGYIEALEEERRKVQVFERELPLCLELVNHGEEHKSNFTFISYVIFFWECEILKGSVLGLQLLILVRSSSYV